MIENQFYSFHYSQVPGLEQLYQLARQHSYAPAGVDPLRFEHLSPDDRLYARRATLDTHPSEEAILRREHELSLSKGDSNPQIGTAELRSVETERHRQVLSNLQPFVSDPSTSSTPAAEGLRERSVKHRVASGYVKLDDRRSRMRELIAAVDDFFGLHCHCQGDYWYPRGGFRDWHTNKFDTPGWRLYIIDVDVPRQSYFRFKHPRTNELTTIWDQPGTFNFFLIDPQRLLWHCIGAQQANRWSKGFVVPDTWLETVVDKIESGG